MTTTKQVKPSTIIEVLSAACDTRYIEGPFPERGAIFLIAPSGHFKNTLINAATLGRSDVLLFSKLTGRQWNDVKGQFIEGRYTCLVLPEFENIYRGASSTASHVEAIIQDVIADGYTYGPNQDPRIPRLRARALLIGGLTPTLLERHYKEWEEGMLRRSIWCFFHLANVEQILNAIHKWKKIDFGSLRERPASGEIPMDITEDESRMLEDLMKDQPGKYGTGMVLLKKIAAVLKWRYKRTKEPEQWKKIIQEFGLSLRTNGVSVTLNEP